MARQRAKRSSAAKEKTCTVTDLAQVKALADPLRLRILGVFARGPHTTKQVAVQLNEKPTRLYHHVEALLRAGLIELRETRPNRGTVEKYFEAIANRFAVPEALLSTGSASHKGPVPDVVHSILDSTRDDLARWAEAGAEVETAPLVARALLCGSVEQMNALRDELLAMLEREKTSRARSRSSPSDNVTFALTIAFYRLPESL